MLVLLLALGQAKKIKDDLSLKIEKKLSAMHIIHAFLTYGFCLLVNTTSLRKGQFEF